MPVSKRFKREAKREIRRLRRERATEVNMDGIGSGADFVRFNRAADQWGALIKRGLKKQFKTYGPDRPGMALRTGQGSNYLKRIFTSSGAADYWDDQGAFKKAKAFYLKYNGKAAQAIFNWDRKYP